METKKEKGQITEVARKEGTKGDYFTIKLAGRNYTIFAKTEAFDTLSDKLVKLNDFAEIEFSETQGTFKGAPVTYKNGLKIIKVETMPSQSNVTYDPKATITPSNEIWAAKDRRIVRMASINAAIELIKNNFTALPKEVQQAGVAPTVVMAIAKQFEEWVYRTDPEVDKDEYN